MVVAILVCKINGYFAMILGENSAFSSFGQREKTLE